MRRDDTGPEGSKEKHFAHYFGIWFACYSIDKRHSVKSLLGCAVNTTVSPVASPAGANETPIDVFCTDIRQRQGNWYHQLGEPRMMRVRCFTLLHLKSRRRRAWPVDLPIILYYNSSLTASVAALMVLLTTLAASSRVLEIASTACDPPAAASLAIEATALCALSTAAAILD